ncbi:MDR family MFS transporter [Geomicrobium sediminis]|uniref:MFS family permease n=1 Tax=Geomicrobium sediminis TaxID=1347788 RepID=A0ABS2P907_9BACL|nr:MFS transporter [Geomicrobium sediminis]MBM7631898.1 MFS family permease [Geomicrobium sediminis]
MPKIIWLLIIGMSTNVIASSFLWPLNTIYIHEQLGEPLSAAGVVLMMYAGAGVIGNIVGGRLFDVIGGYKTLVIGMTFALGFAILLAFNHEYYQYMAFLTGIGLGHGMIVPVFYSLAGSLWPEGGRRPFNAMYVAQNVGVSAGTALAGIVAAFHIEMIFVANSITYLLLFLFAVIAYRGIQERSTSSAQVQKSKNFKQQNMSALAILSVGFLICWVAYVQWLSNISVHMQSLNIDLYYYSLLWTLNGLLIVIMQPVMAIVVRKWVTTLKAQLITGAIIFAGAFLVLTQAEVFTVFLLAMIILTFGELFVWPAVPTIANKMAPKGSEGFYQGIVNSVATGGRMIGPLLGGMIVDHYDMHTMFFVILSLFIIAIISFAMYDRPLRKSNKKLPLQS